MSVEIKITPLDIDNLVKDAILKSSLGKMIEEAIAKAIQPSYSGKSFIQNCIDQAIIKIIEELILGRGRVDEPESEYKIKIKEAVKVKLEEVLSSEAMQERIDEIVRKLASGRSY
jgi:hypothetical protein